MNNPKRLEVQVKAGSKKGPLVERVTDSRLTVYTPVRAVDGKANQAVIDLLSDYMNVPKTRIRIRRGLTSSHKIIDIT